MACWERFIKFCFSNHKNIYFSHNCFSKKFKFISNRIYIDVWCNDLNLLFLYLSVLFWSHHLLHVTAVIDTDSCIFLVLELFEVPSAEKVWASLDEHKRCSGLGILFLLVQEHPSFIQSIGIIRAFCLPEGTC